MFLLAKNNTIDSNYIKSNNLHSAYTGYYTLFHSTSALTNTWENNSHFVYFQGTPCLSDTQVENIVDTYISTKDKSSFIINKGIYLIIIIDKGNNNISIYRDAWGNIPTYYNAQKLIVSDSISMLSESLDNDKLNLNPNAIAEFLCSSYVVGANTLFKEIISLEPLDFLTIKKDQFKPSANHHYPKVDYSIKADDLTEMIEKHIDTSIQELINTVKDPSELFVALSGGTDSSLLVSKINEKTNYSKLTCGTVEYANWDRNDTIYYNTVVDHYKYQRNIEIINNNKYASSLLSLNNKAKYAYHTFGPSFNSLLSTITKKNPEIKYHINGTGPDESVIGFEKIPIEQMKLYDKIEQNEWIDCLFKNLEYFYTPIESAQEILNPSFYHNPLSNRIKIAEKLVDTSESFSEFQRRYAMQTITDHHIKMLYHIAQINDLDTIYPYCTQELFDLSFKASYYAINQPESYKNMYKRILLKYFDHEFVYRPKIGFHAPSRVYFKDKDGMNNIVNNINLNTLSEIFNTEKTANQINIRLTQPDAPLDYLLWTISNIDILYKNSDINNL